jgi:prepilin-type N-terminal cleavage/methylation domain-containing protein
MARKSYPLPTAREIADALEMPLDEAETLLCRIQSQRLRKSVVWPRLTLLEVLVTAAILGVLAAVLYPVMTPTRGCGPRYSCLSNVKQLSMALLMYGSDYDDRLPPATIWQDAILAYHKNPQLLTCTSRRCSITAA